MLSFAEDFEKIPAPNGLMWAALDARGQRTCVPFQRFP
jgi:hypothetical protein